MPRNSGAETAACAPATRFILRGGREVAASAGAAFGAMPPLEPLRSATAGPRSALWLGPDEWLLIAAGADAGDIGGVLESVLEGTAHGLVDVSHRQIGLIASGPAAARVLNAGYRGAARTLFGAAVQHHPDNLTGHVNLANLLFLVGEQEQARVHFEAALRHMWRRWCAGLPPESFATGATVEMPR